MAEKELKTIKFQMMLSEKEAEEIDDWSFKNRIRSRAEAIRRLCQIGIMVSEEAPKISDLAFSVTEDFTKFLKSDRGGSWFKNNRELRADAFMRYSYLFEEVTDLVARAEAFRTHESVEAAKEESDMIASFRRELAPWLANKD